MDYIKRMNILRLINRVNELLDSIGDFMKIAVCFFGHLRTFKRCAPYIKFNLLKHYDCDYLCILGQL